MTETTFPFGTVEDAPLEAEAGSKRTLVLAGGLVAALAVAGGAFLFLGGDDLEEEAFVPTPQAAAPAAEAEPVAAAPKLPVPFDEDLGRDPFRALYVQPAAAPAVDPADPTLPQGAPTDGSLPGGTTGLPIGGPTTGGSTGGQSTGGQDDGGSGSEGAGPVTPDAPTAREYPLQLKRVYGTGPDQTAEFTIDDRKVVAKVGVRFGPTNEIRLISLQEGPKDGQWTAVLQVGDGEPFDAITGETVSVR